MFELHITCTGRSFNPREKYSIFHQDREQFGTIKEVYAFLRERYGKSKRVPMFIDKKDGSTHKIGWVIGFRASDLSHAPVQHWLQQDWIEVRKSDLISL